MIKVAVNIIPLKSAHKYRGIGYYTSHLLEALKQDSEVEVFEFSNLSDIPKTSELLHYPWFDLFFHTLPLTRGLPTVITIHDVIPLIFPKYYPVGVRGKINNVIQKVALKSCKYIITDSNTSKRDIMKYLKIEDKKIVVIPLAPDQRFKLTLQDTKLLYIKRKYNLPSRFLLYVGDSNWVKNLPFLIEGFRQLLNIPAFADVKLVLVGGVFLKNVENIDHPELVSLKQVNSLIKQYRLEGHIIKPGQITDDELVVFYKLATIYVQPSLYEGFGLPILQAFASGTPVVSSNKGSLTEIGGEAPIYFDPKDINQFVSVIGEVLGNASLRNKLIKLGLEQAEKFSWNKVEAETKSVYLKVVK